MTKPVEKPAESSESSKPSVATLKPSFLISVDVETDEVNTRTLQVLSIGACSIKDPRVTFYEEISAVKPTYAGSRFNFEALRMVYPGLTWAGFDPIGDPINTPGWINTFYEKTRKYGVWPREVMERFAAWVIKVTPSGHTPVMVAAPAAFDIPLIEDGFKRVGVESPFPIAGICLKTLLWRELSGYSGSWDIQRTARLPADLVKGLVNPNPHNSRADAVHQAKLFNNLRIKYGS